MVIDFFDPNTWIQEDHEYRIYADDYANDYAIVDQVDYIYLTQWRWKLKKSKASGNRTPKMYVARSGYIQTGPDFYDDSGKRTQSRLVSTIFLHTEVMERAGIPKPLTNEKIIVDHANGKGFDCRRKNLRWATIGFNNKNKFGSHEYVMFKEVL